MKQHSRRIFSGRGRRRYQPKAKRRVWIWVLAAAVVIAIAAVIWLVLRKGQGGDPSAPSPAPTPVVSPTPTPAQGATLNQRSLYECALEYEPNLRKLSGMMRLTYTNNAGEDLYEIPLHLYPNAVEPGCMEIVGVALNGVNTFYHKENGASLIRVPLVPELKNGETAEVFIEFNISVPERESRFGAGKNAVMLGNALPIAAEYEDGAWRTDAYDDTGDPFYSAASDYKVALTVPERFTVAATGAVLEEKREGGKATRYFYAAGAREFAFALSDKWTEAEAGDIPVSAYAESMAYAKFGADTAAGALKWMAQKVCPYPFERICVTQADMRGGMEYPGLVMIENEQWRKLYRARGEFIIVHEVIHQWLYALVGSDQINEPWVDESLTEYLAYAYLEDKYGEEYARELYDEAAYGLFGYDRRLRLDSPLSAFAQAEPNAYYYVIYAYGASVYRELHEMLGDEAFFGAIKNYCLDNSFGFGTGDKLIACFSEAAGEDLASWFEGRM